MGKVAPDFPVWVTISVLPGLSLLRMGLRYIWYGRAAAFLLVFSLTGSGKSVSFGLVHISYGYRLSVG